MQKVVSALLILVGIIHLLPLSGVLGAERLSALYGIVIDQPDLVIMMRHRAILFGILGLFLIYSAFSAAFQPAALLAGFVSVTSFIAIALSTGGYNGSIGKVVVADIIALAFLLVAAGLYFYQSRQVSV